MVIQQQFLTKNECYKRGKTMIPKGIMVHSTGCNQPFYSGYLSSWNGPIEPKKCVHGFIGRSPTGSVQVVQTMPWTMAGWHAGGSANNSYIGFEICEDDLHNSNYFLQVYQEAIELCAMLCTKFKLNPQDDIICHSEGYKLGVASNHADVMHWFPIHGKSMNTFRNDVAKFMKGDDDMDAKQIQQIVDKEFAERDESIQQYNQKLGDWASVPWATATRMKLVDGTRPGAPLTRQEFITILGRLGMLNGGN